MIYQITPEVAVEEEEEGCQERNRRGNVLGEDSPQPTLQGVMPAALKPGTARRGAPAQGLGGKRSSCHMAPGHAVPMGEAYVT